MKHKIVITTPYPTDEEVIRILGISPEDVAYVDRLMVKIGLPKPIRQSPVASAAPKGRRLPSKAR